MTRSYRFVRVLLLLFPREFRAAHGAEMARVFGDQLRAASLSGRRALLRTAVRGVWDFAASGIEERIVQAARDGSWKGVVLLLLALAMGAFTGWVDTHNDEVQAAVLCLVAFTFVLGVLSPRRVWLWWLLLGLSVPLAHALYRWRGWDLPYPVGGNAILAPALALIPAAIVSMPRQDSAPASVTSRPASRSASAPASRPALIEGIEYAPGGDDCTLDLHLPDGREPYATVVGIVGGGWHTGSRRSWMPIGRRLQRAGIAAACISHRSDRGTSGRRRSRTRLRRSRGSRRTSPSTAAIPRACSSWATAPARSWRSCSRATRPGSRPGS